MIYGTYKNSVRHKNIMPVYDYFVKERSALLPISFAAAAAKDRLVLPCIFLIKSDVSPVDQLAYRLVFLIVATPMVMVTHKKGVSGCR